MCLPVLLRIAITAGSVGFMAETVEHPDTATVKSADTKTAPVILQSNRITEGIDRLSDHKSVKIVNSSHTLLRL